MYKCPQETKIGLTVGKLRSNADKQVSALARELVKKASEPALGLEIRES